ncbi:MAG: sulfatase-like hydrolase/transferase [Rhodospirillales bacterium]
MVLGFKTPHGPSTDGRRHRGPSSFSSARKSIRRRIPATYPPYFVNREVSTPSGKLRNCFRTVAGMDQDVGQVLDALDAAKIADSTVVVFASDNGRTCASTAPITRSVRRREAQRLRGVDSRPVVLRYPRLSGGGRKIGATVLNIDLAPTLLRLAGLPPRPDMRGRAGYPCSAGAETIRSGMFYEYFREKGYIVPRIIAFRRNNLKLIEYPDHPEYPREFYDVLLDPWR